jgi:Ca-activated chloride channel family protein
MHLSRINNMICTKDYFCFFAVVLLSIGVLLPVDVQGESLHSKIEKGSNLYQDERYDEAMESFVDAQIESPEEAKLKYNIANTHYKMNNYKEAVKNYQDVAATAQDITLEERSLYNIGNCMYRQGKLEEAVEYYKKALELDPNDQDAKYNLEFVREEIKKRINQAKQREQQQQNQQQQEQQQQDQAQDQQKPEPQDNKKEQEKQQQAQGEEQKKQQEQQPEPRQEQAKSASKEKEKTEQMTPEEAERWLRSLKEGKRKPKQSEERQTAGSLKPEKDW